MRHTIGYSFTHSAISDNMLRPDHRSTGFPGPNPQNTIISLKLEPGLSNVQDAADPEHSSIRPDLFKSALASGDFVIGHHLQRAAHG